MTVTTIDIINNSSFKDGYVENGSTAVTTSTTVGVGTLDNAVRSFFDFDISSIPDTDNITKVEILLTKTNADYSENLNYYSLSAKADTRIDASQSSTLYAECGGTGSTTLITNDSVLTSASINTRTAIDLGSAGVTALEGNLSSDFFSVGIKQYANEGDGDLLFIAAYENATSGYRPQLRITHAEEETTSSIFMVN